MLNLSIDSKEYASSLYKYLFNRRKRLKWYFLTLNILAVLGALFTTVLTAILVSKLVYEKYPDWFFFATAGSSAMLSLVSSFLNFFIIKDTINKIANKLNKIEKIMILHSNKLTDKFKGNKADFHLYNDISIIVNSKSKKQEVKNG